MQFELMMNLCSWPLALYFDGGDDEGSMKIKSNSFFIISPRVASAVKLIFLPLFSLLPPYTGLLLKLHIKGLASFSTQGHSYHVLCHISGL